MLNVNLIMRPLRTLLFKYYPKSRIHDNIKMCVKENFVSIEHILTQRSAHRQIRPGFNPSRGWIKI